VITPDTAVIVCAGPSLDLLTARAWADVAHAGAIVAVNGASASEACLRNRVRFTVISAMDLHHGLRERVPRLSEVWQTTPAWRITAVDATGTEAESYVTEVDEEHGICGWSDHPDQGYKGGSTGMVTGNWMANGWPDDPASLDARREIAAMRGKSIPRRGFRRLAYLGLDMIPLDGRHAAGAGNHASGFSSSIEHHRYVCGSWGKFCMEAAKRGIEVVNLTPNTGLDTMPRLELPEWSLVA
jgi:hypothetical protein